MRLALAFLALLVLGALLVVHYRHQRRRWVFPGLLAASVLVAPTLAIPLLTLAAVPYILEHGPEADSSLGSGRSLGTQVFPLAGNIRQGGIVETAFGVTLRELVEGYGGGTLSGRPLRAVQLGGPLGAYLPASALDVTMDYESVAEAGGMLGHGGVVVFDDTLDLNFGDEVVKLRHTPSAHTDGDSLVYFRGTDPAMGRMTKYTVVQDVDAG